MMSLMQDDTTWTTDHGYKLRCEIYINVVRFLASQTQEKLPYRVKFVNSNDQIFIGSEDFESEANRMMDFCFSQVLEKITKMNEEKEKYGKELFMLCINCANLLIGVANTGHKDVSKFINKMFKMADGFMTDYNGRQPQDAPPYEKLSRNLINKSFDVFKKKKDNLKEAQIRASTRSSMRE